MRIFVTLGEVTKLNFQRRKSFILDLTLCQLTSYFNGISLMTRHFLRTITNPFGFLHPAQLSTVATIAAQHWYQRKQPFNPLLGHNSLQEESRPHLHQQWLHKHIQHHNSIRNEREFKPREVFTIKDVNMKMSKLSNQTNSQDPQAVNSRVFVGNLNTFQCSKTDVERMFQRYGRLAGISMHKGYAFVQFTNPFDARNACHGEDGRTVLSQVLDVNMVAEPKPHQIGRKRQNVTKTGNDWDYYYDSYYASTLFPTTGPRPMKRQRLMTPQSRVVGNPANKLASVQQAQQQQQQAAAAAMAAMAASAAAAQAVQANMLPQQQIVLHQQALLQNGTNVNNIVASCNGTTTTHSLSAAKLTGVGPGGSIVIQPATSAVSAPASTTNNNHTTLTKCEQISSLCTNGQILQLQQYQQQQHQLLGPFKVYSNPDTLICGNCRECFSDLGELLDHKRTYCKLRFTCKCQDSLLASKNPLPTTKLLCAVCKDAFTNPWDLMVHAQAAHMVNIYELGNETTSSTESEEPAHKENGSSNGNASDTEPIVELNGDVGSPNGTLKEDGHADDASLDDRMSSSPAPQSEDMKLNGSVSSRGSSPILENEPPRACIELSIEATSQSSQTTSSTIGMVSSSLGIGMSNGTPTVASQ